MKIEIDQEKCCAAGHCVLVAPEVFDQRDRDGVVVLRDTEPPRDRHAAVLEAAELCPALAITVHED